MTNPSFATTGTSIPDDLLTSHENAQEAVVTLASGENVARGAVLGKVTADGKYRLSLQAETDGSQTPDAIAAVDMDATAGDQEIVIYIAGNFNENALTIGTGHTADSIREGLRDKQIVIEKALAR